MKFPVCLRFSFLVPFCFDTVLFSSPQILPREYLGLGLDLKGCHHKGYLEPFFSDRQLAAPCRRPHQNSGPVRSALCIVLGQSGEEVNVLSLQL